MLYVPHRVATVNAAAACRPRLPIAPFLSLVFGEGFVPAYTTLVLLVAAATITIAGFSFDPAIYAMGRPGIPLRVNAFVILLIYLPLLVVLTQTYGPAGAGFAMVISALLIVVAVGLWTHSELRQRT